MPGSTLITLAFLIMLPTLNGNDSAACLPFSDRMCGFNENRTIFVVVSMAMIRAVNYAEGWGIR